MHCIHKAKTKKNQLKTCTETFKNEKFYYLVQFTMEAFKAAYFTNGHIFSKFHIHITFKFPIKSGVLATTTILLPIGQNKTFHQHQTNIKIAGIANKQRCLGVKQFETIYAALQHHSQADNPILGLKIEGLVDIVKSPQRDELQGFCYVEYHEKFNSPEDVPATETLISYNPSKRRFYSAERIYDCNEIPPYSAYEVCIFEHQFEAFEAKWIENVKNWPKILEASFFLKGGINSHTFFQANPVKWVSMFEM